MKVHLALLLLCGGYHDVVEASSRSIDSAYDTNKGVFSPQGKLVQLDYIEGLVRRGNLCIGAECKDGVVLVTNKLMSADTAKLVDGGVRRIYRADSHLGVLPAGLPADGRALAHKAIEYCRSHRREYGEPIPGRVLAERMADFIHAACVRWGSRAYPNALLIACWEEGVSEDGDGDDDGGLPGGSSFQLYVVEPNGSLRRCRAACTGRGSDETQKWLRRRVLGESTRSPSRDDEEGVEEGSMSSQGARQETTGQLFSQMTAAEATGVLIDAAKRYSDGVLHGSGGRETGGVGSAIEVAWLRRSAGSSGGDRAVELVHHRSLEEFLKEHCGADPARGAEEEEARDGDGLDYLHCDGDV